MIAVTTDTDGVPFYLAQLERWVLWRETTRVNRKTGEMETTKPPIAYHTGKACDVTDPRNWTTFGNAAASLSKSGANDGIGIVLGLIEGRDEILIGLDVDECLDRETGAIADWAMPFMIAMSSYGDLSPGGSGVKCIARIRLTDFAAARKLLGLSEGDKDQARTKHFGVRANGQHAPSVQLFLGKRYFTVTGRHWVPSPEDVTLLSLRQIEQLAFLFGPKLKTSTAAPGARADDDETEPDEAAIRDKLGQAFVASPRLRERWEGGITGLNDTSRSGFDMSIVGLLITANFSRGEIRAALRLFRHGKLVEEEDAGTGDHYFGRMWDRSIASPRAEPEVPADWEERYPPVDEIPLEGSIEQLGSKGPGPPPAPKPGRILTGDAFISSFVPPDWLIDGIVQRGRLYACTSLTGHGKTAVWLFNACMIQAGRMIGQLDVVQGNVLILAGENPEDLQARMHGMAGAYKLKPAQLPYVLPGNFPLDDQEADALSQEIAGLGVPIALILGDTAASFFPGDDENDNVNAGKYARTLRTLTECPGGPAVVMRCHPVKNAGKDNLLPRGGGAFVNELDGNLTLWSAAQGEVTELHWHGKIRGPDFSPLGYRLRSVPTGFSDHRDREIPTIVAEPMSEEAIANHTKQTLANEDVVLQVLRDRPGQSLAQIARDAGWVGGEDDQPEKWRVQRAIASLANDKLIQRARKGGPWELTDKGKKALGEGA
jgi:hypothetical protein